MQKVNIDLSVFFVVLFLNLLDINYVKPKIIYSLDLNFLKK